MATGAPQAGKRPICVLWGGLMPGGGVVIPGGGLSLLTHGGEVSCPGGATGLTVQQC